MTHTLLESSLNSARYLLLSPTDLAPTDPGLQVIGAFNPAAIQTGPDEYTLLVRVVQSVRDQDQDSLTVPGWKNGVIQTESHEADSFKYLDPRVIELRATGHRRLVFTSHFQIVRITNISAVPSEWKIEPQGTILPEGDLETFGIEDPRITKIGDEYFVTYVAVSMHGVCTALMKTIDFVSFERMGVIFVPENKDVVIFPERFDDMYWALHRPTPAQPFCSPEIWLANSNDLLKWGNHRPFLTSASGWEGGRVGGGCVPLRVGDFWLIVYHGSERSMTPGQVGRYVATVAIASADQAPRLIAASPIPLFEPVDDFETQGFVPNVVFPTAITQNDDCLNIFYGAADTAVGVTQMSQREIFTTHFPDYA